MKYIAPVEFNTGNEFLDTFFGSKPEYGYYFNAVYLNSTAKSAKEQVGPVIIPSLIEVGVYADLDKNISYAVRSYKNLDYGRIQLSDFVVKQAWEEIDNQQVLMLRDEEGNVIDRKMGLHALYLASIADLYRLAHNPGVNQ